MARVSGAKELRAALRKAPALLRKEALAEVEKSTEAMYQDVKAELDTVGLRIPFWHGDAAMKNITGRFRRNYNRRVFTSRLSGIVGLYTATARKVFWARFFFYGTIKQPARPVHDEAFEREEPKYIKRQTDALARVLKAIFS